MMNSKSFRWVGAGLGSLLISLAASAQSETPRSENAAQALSRQGDPAHDLSARMTLYCVGYAHLDTQWRWDFTTTIDEYIRRTLDDNFALIEKYPDYVFNFTGSVRYEMMKEYYPQRYERLKSYIEAGRWFVSGSSVDEGDVNVPSAESIVRQVLYGNLYFKREFGKESVDYMLPDCFGFPASMPTIWAHCGLLGFSTQKLTWGSAVGIPFKIGLWEGPDGNSVIAALDPGPYVGAVKGRVDLDLKWIDRVQTNFDRFGVAADYHYYGTGDQGGAPKEEDVRNYVSSINQPDSRLDIVLASSDQMYRDVTPRLREGLPRFKGDMLLTQHSSGTLTSQSYMKRWNRKGEQLADAAERSAVIAAWLGAANYPREKLERSWVRLLANQMHDILPGTSLPRAYQWSWNDEVIALNGFATVATDSVGAISRALDTDTVGEPLVVYNPLAIAREDLVEATVGFGSSRSNAIRVFDPEGREVPSQILRQEASTSRILFVANMEAVSVSVYEVRATDSGYSGESRLAISGTSLENEHYRVTLNDAGDVASVFDKNAKREMLSDPAQLVFTYEKPQSYPAWNMDWNDRKNPPIGVVDGPPSIRIVESGPVRVSLEIERQTGNSVFIQQIRLARGDAGRIVEFDTNIDWQETERTVKASFPLTVSNPNATYNWGAGTIDRGNNEPTKYEVPSHEWFDLTDVNGQYGVTILEDSKFGSDKPSDNEVRLTLLYTPGVRGWYLDQHSQDWGRHDMTYAMYGHDGDWRDGRSEWRGRRLNQPLEVFNAKRHGGPRGRTIAFTEINTEQVDIRAIKMAEESDRIIIRLQELWGQDAKDVRVRFAGQIATAYEVDGQERRLGDALTENGELVVDMSPFAMRAFSVTLTPSRDHMVKPTSIAVSLPYDTDLASTDQNPADGAFDGEGRTIPAEMLPKRIVAGGIAFELASVPDGQPQAVTCRGQEITLPASGDRIYLLAAATRDAEATFRVGEVDQRLSVQAWTGFIGQWDDRVWDTQSPKVDFKGAGQVIAILPGFIKRDSIAWFSTHRHHPENGNESYRFSYLFRYALDRPAGGRTLTLPYDERIKILAISVASDANDVVSPASPLYDDLQGHEPIAIRHDYNIVEARVFTDYDAIGRAIVDREKTFRELTMGPPSGADAIDASGGNPRPIQFLQRAGKYRLHQRSGAVDGTLPRLTDGEAAQNHDDTSRCVWFDGEGRFFVDLGSSTLIDRVNTYSWHRTNRSPQFFSLWGTGYDSMPDADFEGGGAERWQLLAVVDSRKLGDGQIHGSSVTGADGPLGEFRYLLWIAEDIGEGTFFTEIDVHVAD